MLGARLLYSYGICLPSTNLEPRLKLLASNYMLGRLLGSLRMEASHNLVITTILRKAQNRKVNEKNHVLYLNVR